MSQNRLAALDVFRGITIAGMVLVNNPGTWESIYPPLRHADWHGATPTDYIFPFFLFIVGVAIPIALGKRLAAGGAGRDVYFKIATRAALIFFFGIFLAAFPLFDFSNPAVPAWAKIVHMLALVTIVYLWLVGRKIEPLVGLAALAVFLAIVHFAVAPLVFTSLETLRIPGVLQRIAVCYLVVAVLFLNVNWRQLALIGGGLLLFYWLIMSIVPVPGCETTTIDSKECNLAAYLDRVVIGTNHIWRSAKVYDPEGLLSTLPSIATTIAGVLTGLWLGSKRSDLEKVAGMFFFGVILLVAGWCWNPFFPYNKPLWTSSYVLHTAGLALCFLAFCYYLIDIKGYRAWTRPFVIFGVNALALYIGSGLLARIWGIVKVTNADGRELYLQSYIYQTFYAPLAGPQTASLLFALSYILLWLFLMWLLYRKRIFIKV